MKGFAALAVLALLVASTVYGQANYKQAGVKYSGKDFIPIGSYDTSDDSTGRATSGLYPLPVVLTSAVHVTSVLAESLGASKQVDSTAVIPTVNYKSMALMLAPKLGAVGTRADTAITIFVQVRAHRNTTQDTVSTFPWYPWQKGGYGMAYQDSIRTNYGPPTDDAADVSEFKVSIHPNTKSANPKNIYIMLPGYRAPYTSVRFRLQDLVGSAVPAVNLWIDAWLVGFDN